jgi:hypothetical protein
MGKEAWETLRSREAARPAAAAAAAAATYRLGVPAVTAGRREEAVPVALLTAKRRWLSQNNSVFFMRRWRNEGFDRDTLKFKYSVSRATRRNL